MISIIIVRYRTGCAVVLCGALFSFSQPFFCVEFPVSFLRLLPPKRYFDHLEAIWSRTEFLNIRLPALYYLVSRKRTVLSRQHNKKAETERAHFLLHQLQNDDQTLLPRNGSQYPRPSCPLRPRLSKPILGLDTQPKSGAQPLASTFTSLAHFRRWQRTRASLVRICWRWTSFSSCLWRYIC